MNNRIDAIYARQSVDKKDSISIESQIEFCKYELKGGNCKEYTDKGYSGKNTDRPKFQELVRDIKLSRTKGDTAKTFYIGSKNSPIYFCLYEKEKEQRNKGIQTDIKNRFEIRLKNEKAGQAAEELVFSRNPEQTIATWCRMCGVRCAVSLLLAMLPFAFCCISSQVLGTYFHS